MQPGRRVVIAALAITISATAAPQLARAGKAPAVLASLPDDTTMVAAIDIKKVVAAPIAADGLDMVKQRMSVQLDRMKAVGIDLEKNVSKAYLAFAGGAMSDPGKARLKIVIAEGKFSVDANKIADPQKSHDGVSYWSNADVDYALIGKRLYIVSDGKMPDLIDVLHGTAKNAAKSAAAKSLRAAIAATAVKNPGWVVGVTTDADKKLMGSQASDMAWFSASAALRTDAVDFTVRVGMTSAAAAKTLSDSAQSQVAQAKQSMGSVGLGDLGKSLTVGVTGSVVAIGATVTKSEMAVIASLAQMMGSAMTSTTTPAPPPTKPGSVGGPAPTSPTKPKGTP